MLLKELPSDVVMDGSCEIVEVCQFRTERFEYIIHYL